MYESKFKIHGQNEHLMMMIEQLDLSWICVMTAAQHQVSTPPQLALSSYVLWLLKLLPILSNIHGIDF